MTLRKFFAASALSAALLLASPAAAETLRAGAVVTDPQGGQVGTITAIDSQYVTLQTDRHTTRLPVSSFTATDSAILFALTRDQLNTQLDEALAQAQAAIQVGAVVQGRDGGVIGPIEAVDDQNVTVRFGEQQVRFARSSLAPGQNGLIVGLTVDQLRAQVSASSAAAGNSGE
jgi:preprotein translocase subunit YajC